MSSYDHDGLLLQYKLDNEFDLVFVVAYQKILQLSYVDKFLNDIHLEFRDKYKNDLSDGKYFREFDFSDCYNATLQAAESWGKVQAKIPKQMRSFEESVKSKKTVASMIEKKGEEKVGKDVKKKEVNFVEEEVKQVPKSPKVEDNLSEVDVIAASRLKFAQKMSKGKKPEVK